MNCTPFDAARRASGPVSAGMWPRAAPAALALVALVAGIPQHAQAQAQEGSKGMLTGRLHFSTDTDDFDTRRLSLGYLWASGWGLETRASHYSAPGWSATGRALYGAYRSHTDAYTLDARLGVDDTRAARSIGGALEYLHKLTPATSAGVSLERDVVDSVRSVDNRIRYTAGALVLDHAFSDRAGVGASLGNTWFTDGNQRRMLRTRWSYEILPGSGWSAYVKTRHLRNTQPYNGYYFAPRSAQEYAGGMSWRSAVGDSAVFLAQADLGRQRIDGESKGLWSALVGLQSRNRAAVQWRVALELRNDGSSNNAPVTGGSYRYTALTAHLLFPLD